MTLEEARYRAELGVLTGDPLDPAALELVAQREIGPGWSDDPAALVPDLPATFCALRVLSIAGELGSRPETVAWLRSQTSTADVHRFFYAARARALLRDRPDAAESAEIAAMLKSLHHPDGGYGGGPGVRADVQYTYVGVWTRHWLGDIAQGRADAADWLAARCLDGHMAFSADDPSWSLATGASGHRCADLLGLDWPWEQVRAAAERERRPDGTFGGPLENYCGLRIIALADQHLAETWQTS
ncbi:hypothetical protein ACWGE0_03055 [Lentzea sp. NPDC054927]